MGKLTAFAKCLCFISTTAVSGVTIAQVVSEAQFDRVIDNKPGRLAVISFDSPACGESCRVMKLPFIRLSEIFSDTVDFAMVDAENAFEVAMVAGIEVVPSVQFYLNGLQVGNIDGPDEAEQLRQKLEALIELARSSRRSLKENLPQEPSSRISVLERLQRWLSEGLARLGESTLALPAPPVAAAPAAFPASSAQPGHPKAVASSPAKPAAAAASAGTALAQGLAQSGTERGQAMAHLQAQAQAQARADARAHAQAQMQAQMIQAQMMPAQQQWALHPQQAQMHHPAPPQPQAQPHPHIQHPQWQYPGLPSSQIQTHMYMSR